VCLCVSLFRKDSLGMWRDVVMPFRHTEMDDWLIMYVCVCVCKRDTRRRIIGCSSPAEKTLLCSDKPALIWAL